MNLKSGFFLIVLTTFTLLFGQTDHDYVYFKNFVRHSEGEFCTHIPPQASFVAHLNNHQDHILLENAPRWEIGGDPNITGMGVFGVELGNFAQPSVTAGDSVHMRFTCLATSQQGRLSARVTGIPWGYFPLTLNLRSLNFPGQPQNLILQFTPTGERLLSWTAQGNATYSVYRRMVADTVYNGQSRMLYERLTYNLAGNTYLDTTSSRAAHGYIVIPEMSGIPGPHSAEVVDFPGAPHGIEAAVAYINPFQVAVTWLQGGNVAGMFYRVYRSETAGVPIDSAHMIAQTTELFWLDGQVYSGAVYYYRVVGVNEIGIPSLPSPETRVTVVPFANGLPDLDVLLISRSPRYPRFEVAYNPPGYNPHLVPGTQNLKHYPNLGELMIYNAIIRNSGGGTIEDFVINWYVDSVLVHTDPGSRLFPRQKVFSRLQQPWTAVPVRISCQVVPIPTVTEVSAQNNLLYIRSNALSFRFHAEKNILTLFETHQNPMGSYSFEDWSQVQLRKLNQFFVEAVYPPFAPAGVPEAVFLDTVLYYDNGALPSGGTHAPEAILWDGQWGFTGDPGAINYFQNIVLGQNQGMDWALLHELGHQIGLIDLYVMDVHLNQFHVIEPRTGQRPPLTPIAWEVLFYCSRSNFLMHSGYQNGLSDHSAGGLMRNLSKRRGFYGDYLADIPADNTLIIRYPDGTRVRNTEIWIYQCQDDQVPNITKFRGMTDGDGRYLFPHVTDTSYAGGIPVKNPFSTIYSEDPHVVATNSVLFMRVARRDSVGYYFMDICDYNVAYWSGHTLSATYPVTVSNWFIIPGTGIEDAQSELPQTFRLFQNSPNPFNPVTTLRYHLAGAVTVELKIYDVLGREIRTVVYGKQPAGKYSVNWDGRDDSGNVVSSGVYICRLSAGNFLETRKMILIR